MNQPTHWTAFKAPGNKYMFPLHSSMMEPDGYTTIMYRKKRGKDEYETTCVKYDTSYIVEKFKREYLEPLDCTWEEFTILMNEIFLAIKTPDKDNDKEKTTVK